MALAVLVLGSCGRDVDDALWESAAALTLEGGARPSAVSPDSVEPTSQATVRRLREAAAVTESINHGEMLKAGLATSRSRQEDVLALARSIYDAHSEAQAWQEYFLELVGVRPLPGLVSSIIDAQTAGAMASGSYTSCRSTFAVI
jgi:predicted outer membrane protein